jgi:hypothetical protein
MEGRGMVVTTAEHVTSQSRMPLHKYINHTLLPLAIPSCASTISLEQIKYIHSIYIIYSQMVV